MSEANELRSERLIRAAEVAQALNISRALVYRLIQKGEIPAVHINSTIRVRPRDVEEFITRHLEGTDHT